MPVAGCEVCYWTWETILKRPAGSTGPRISLSGIATEAEGGAGTGAGEEVVDVADTVVDVALTWVFFSERVEYIAAVTPAPVAALTAMIAIVAFDIWAWQR